MRLGVISSGEQMTVQKDKAVSGHIALTPAQGARTEAGIHVQGRTRHFMRTGCAVCGQQAPCCAGEVGGAPPSTPRRARGNQEDKALLKAGETPVPFTCKTKCFLPWRSMESGDLDQFMWGKHISRFVSAKVLHSMFSLPGMFFPRSFPSSFTRFVWVTVQTSLLGRPPLLSMPLLCVNTPSTSCNHFVYHLSSN